jgi:PhnB protein
VAQAAIVHANFRIGETQLMADDGIGDKAAEYKWLTLAIEAADDAEAKRVFMALGEGGKGAAPGPARMFAVEQTLPALAGGLGVRSLVLAAIKKW